jgi:hypothetical protein
MSRSRIVARIAAGALLLVTIGVALTRPKPSGLLVPGLLLAWGLIADGLFAVIARNVTKKLQSLNILFVVVVSLTETAVTSLAFHVRPPAGARSGARE